MFSALSIATRFLRLLHLVPLHRNHCLTLQYDVITWLGFVRAVDGPLKHDTVYDAIESIESPIGYDHAVPALELVDVAHMGNGSEGLWGLATGRCQKNVSLHLAQRLRMLTDDL